MIFTRTETTKIFPVLGSAYLDDYAFFTAGLLDLFEATGDPYWLKMAMEMDDIVTHFYEDTRNGGFFMSASDQENVLVREKPVFDDALPSGNSIQIMNLLRLAQFTTNEQYRKRAEKALKFFSNALNADPTAFPELLLAVDYYLDTSKEIVIVTPRGNKASAASLLSAFRGEFVPNRIIVVVAEGEEQSSMATIVPLVRGKRALEGKATAYLCENRNCRLPVSDPNLFIQQLRHAEQLTANR